MKPTGVASVLPPVSSTLPLDFMETSPPANVPSVPAPRAALPSHPPPPSTVGLHTDGDIVSSDLSRTASYSEEFLRFASTPVSSENVSDFCVKHIQIH